MDTEDKAEVKEQERSAYVKPMIGVKSDCLGNPYSGMAITSETIGSGVRIDFGIEEFRVKAESLISNLNGPLPSRTVDDLKNKLNRLLDELVKHLLAHVAPVQRLMPYPGDYHGSEENREIGDAGREGNPGEGRVLHVQPEASPDGEGLRRSSDRKRARRPYGRLPR